MFYVIYADLCAKKGISESKAAESIGLNRSAVVKWKKGTVPGGNTIQKLAEFFGVTTDYLLGTEMEQAPTPKDRECSEKEWEVINAYRNKPEFQSAVDVLLGLKGE